MSCVSLAGLQFGRENLDDSQPALAGKTGKPKTKRSCATLGLPGRIVDELIAHRNGSSFTEPDDFIFCRSDGSPLDPDHLRRQVLYPAMERAGIQRTKRAHGFHVFRHSTGSILFDAGEDVKSIQEYLRHSRLTTTMDVYLHPETVSNQLETLDVLLSGGSRAVN